MSPPLAVTGHGPQQRAEHVDVQKGYLLVCMLAVASLAKLVSTWIVHPSIVERTRGRRHCLP